MDKQTLKNISDVLAGKGNIGLVLEHVGYFEKKVPDEIAPFLSERKGCLNEKNWACLECHNFSAWLRLYTELICNKALTKLSHNELCKKGPADLYFGDTIRTTIKKAAEVAKKKGVPAQRFEGMSRALKLVIELRHSLQHGGLPRPIRKKARSEDIDLKEVAEMSIPQNFSRTRQIFLDANSLLELLPTKIIVLHREGEVEFLAPLEREVTRGILKDLHERFGPTIPKGELAKAVEKARREIEAGEKGNGRPGEGNCWRAEKEVRSESLIPKRRVI